MSVDYNANFGIGYEVQASDEIADTKELDGGLGEYLYKKDSSANSLTCGSYYSGKCSHYLVIRDPFKDGFDLTKAKSELDEEIKRLKLITIGKFGEVGGILVS